MDKRVLLIDFDPVAAELTGALLATRGIPFALARNHAELDRALAAGPPALVVIDPARPDETEGMRLCTSVAERLGPAGRVPIILASRSLRGARWKALARDAGAELFLERPKDDRLLLAAAERALAQAGAAPAPAARVAVRPPAPTTTGPAPGPTTTAVSHRAPPPPENELENMVDQMFAQWFAEGEGPGSPAPASPAASAPVAARTGATAAAVLDAPGTLPTDADRTPTGSVRSSAPSATPVAAAPALTPQVRASAAPASPRPAGSTGPTGPMLAVSRPAPTGAPAAPARPAPAAPPRVAAALQPAPAVPAPLAGTAAAAGSAGPGMNLMRPVAIAAAVVLIGLGVGFVVLQKSGGAEETATETTASAPQQAQPSADQQPIGAEPAAGVAAAAPSGATPAPATGPTAPAAKVATDRPAGDSPASAKTSPRAESPIQDVAAVRPAPATPPPASPPPPSTPTPATATAPAVATTPTATTATAVPDPQPESEFIPDVAPDGTLPAAELAGDATLARYVGPELIASTRATPAFPPGARQMRMSGQVKLQVKVRADGSVGAVTVLSEPKPAVGFGKAAETAVRQWRYRPATMGSRAVESEIVVVVNFAGD